MLFDGIWVKNKEIQLTWITSLFKNMEKIRVFFFCNNKNRSEILIITIKDSEGPENVT